MLRTLVPLVVTTGGVRHWISLWLSCVTCGSEENGRVGGALRGRSATAFVAAVVGAGCFGPRPSTRSRTPTHICKNASSRGGGRWRATKRAQDLTAARMVRPSVVGVLPELTFSMADTLAVILAESSQHCEPQWACPGCALPRYCSPQRWGWPAPVAGSWSGALSQGLRSQSLIRTIPAGSSGAAECRGSHRLLRRE
jgi:hypothetical protein